MIKQHFDKGNLNFRDKVFALDYSLIFLVLLLGIITTALGHTLFLNSFSHFRISTASIISSIQPLFGVLLGILFLNEIPGVKSIIGGVLILITILMESRLSKLKK
mgnify:CR=1 FL=1